MRNAKKPQKSPKPYNQRRTVKAPGRYGQAATAIRSIKPSTAGFVTGNVGSAVGSVGTGTTSQGGRAGPQGSVRPSRKPPVKRDPVRRAAPGHALSYAHAVKKMYTYPDGTETEARVHPTRTSYEKAKKMIRHEASVAEGTVWKSEPAQEFSDVRKDGQHLVISGREFLSDVYVVYDVAATDSLNSIGERVTVRPLSPESIGGRIQRLSELYESHKAKKFKIVYAPVVPTSTTGALALAFVNDVATTQQVTGVSEMVHLSTACDFVEFPVWQTCELEIDPDRFTREVADEQEGDARFTTDGLLVVLLAGPISNAGPGSIIFGNLFIEYEYDFSSPLLDLDVSAPISGSITVSGGAATTTNLGTAFAALGPTPGTYASWGPTGFAITSCPDYLLTITIQAVTVTTSLPTLRILDSVSTFKMAPGQTYFCRAALSSTPADVFLFFFDSLEAASNFVFDQGSSSGALTSGQVLYDATTAAGTHQYNLKCIANVIDLSTNAVV